MTALPRPFPAAAAGILLAAALCIDPSIAKTETLEVVGVASDDVLNLRAEPRAGARIVGALAPTAGGIEVLQRSDGWAYVQFRDLKGWAAARYLRPHEMPGGKPPLPLHCVGTEPFWSLGLDGKQADFQTPETKAAAASAPFEQSRNSTIVWRVRPSDGPVASATIEAPQACTDNMSDRIYSFSIRVDTRDGRFLSGCCEVER